MKTCAQTAAYGTEHAQILVRGPSGNYSPRYLRNDHNSKVLFNESRVIPSLDCIQSVVPGNMGIDKIGLPSSASHVVPEDAHFLVSPRGVLSHTSRVGLVTDIVAEVKGPLSTGAVWLLP